MTTSLEKTLSERGSRYGDFSDHARLAQQLIQILQQHGQERVGPCADEDRLMFGTPWARLSCVQQQALTVICDKIARILNGNPNYPDNWHDIQGYAKLVEDRLPKELSVPCEF